MQKTKAIFLDRDGIINKIIFDRETGKLYSPVTVSQIEYMFGIFDFLKTVKKLGYLLIIVSNQPGIGLKKMSKKNFLEVKKKIAGDLTKENVSLDAQYYCLHHPYANIKQYRRKCRCRKPETLLFENAINKFNIDPEKSWMIGDGVYDMIAGNKIGLKTILIANIHESAYLSTLEQELEGVVPNFLVKNLKKAAIIVEENS